MSSGQAQTIAATCHNDTLPLIVSGAQGEAMLRIEGVSTMNAPLYLIDSEEGTTTELTADITLSQSANGVRYYLITDQNDLPDVPETRLPRVTAQNHRITIYAPADASITTAGIYTTGGSMVHQAHDITQSESVILPEGIYIVKLLSNGSTYTFKLLLGEN